jgi:crotonobetainyl-CoA:carnitine CoA-transferase CaiB-like acyl-CoA transferase
MVRTQDGRALTIHLSSPPKFWSGLLRAIGRDDLATHPDFAAWSDRVRNYELLQAELAPVFATKPRDEWLALLEREDVPAAPGLDLAEALSDAQAASMNLVTALDGAAGRAELGVRCPVLIDGEQLPGSAAPRLGEHSDEILAELGYTAGEISQISGMPVGGDVAGGHDRR